MFRLTTLIALLSTAVALRSDSQAGQALLAKSRSLEGNADASYDWMMKYSMVFQSCHTVSQFNGADAGDGQQITYSNVVKFKLCPTNKCRYGCTGAEYIADMNSFVDAWTEWTMNDQEYQCEQQREKCNCDYYDDQETCMYNCFTNAGLSECIEDQGDDAGGFNFNLQEWLQCTKSEAFDKYGNSLYVGPKCSKNGEQINLGVFSDDACTEEYSSAVFAQYYGGNTLPYQDKNIVAENCISCKQYDNYYASLTPICEEIYPSSAKCETKLAKYISYPSEEACPYVNNIRLYEKNYKPVSAFASTFFAVVFFISTIALAGIAIRLHRLNSRKIKLSTNAAIV